MEPSTEKTASAEKLTDAARETLAAAFTEWERRYREDPDRFMDDTERLAETCETYGEACAAYLLEILGELDASPAVESA